MARVLKVDQGDIKKIAEEVGGSAYGVSLALKGATATVRSRKIRALAISKYHARVLKEVELTPEELLDELSVNGEV